jgi:hypothetical protein
VPLLSRDEEESLPEDMLGTPISFNILRGHGNEADFLGFLHKSVRHRSLTLHFEPFRFWIRKRGDIRNRNRLPDSPSRGVDKSAYRYNFFQTFK